MNRVFAFLGGLTFLLMAAGCATPLPPGVERGPNGTIAYDVLVEASEPGARIEVNGEIVGNTPIHIKVFGDRDGTFHDFGSYAYEIRALPITTNQFAQIRLFNTGHMLSPEDRIPSRVYFDMNQAPAPRGYAPGYPPVYYAPPPPVYYYEPAPYFYGPSLRFDIGPRFHRYHHHR
jgi:hypothetical protein